MRPPALGADSSAELEVSGMAARWECLPTTRQLCKQTTYNRVETSSYSSISFPYLLWPIQSHVSRIMRFLYNAIAATLLAQTTVSALSVGGREIIVKKDSSALQDIVSEISFKYLIYDL